jgi:hypothetical protein
MPESASAVTFQTGDVFAAISTGRVNWYRADGTLVKQLNSLQPSYTTGMAFDVSGNLYVTNFGATNVSRFDNAGNLLGTFGSGHSGSPESIVFDAGGNVYVGSVNGDNKIRKFDPTGIPLAQYAVALERRGSDWIDLSTDQKTMFYTSEGRRIMRYNVSGAGNQLPDFATLPGSGDNYALRLLTPGDGSGGLLVADTYDIKRLDGSGNVVKTYDVPGEDSWFALNLDPDGSSFWSGNFSSGKAYKFNIATGGAPLQTINTRCGSMCLWGLVVFAEQKAARLKLRFPLAPYDVSNARSRIGLDDRINSFFDHQYPLYSGEATYISETQDVTTTLMKYTGERVPLANIGNCTLKKTCYSGHDGIDFKAIDGADIYPAHEGRAVADMFTCNAIRSGKTISAEVKRITITKDRYRTVYLHVRDDDLWQSLHIPRDLTASDLSAPIARVGNTGSPACSDGAHLHFGVYHDIDGKGSWKRADPYGFNRTNPDPWESKGGARSEWLWTEPEPAQTLALANNRAILSSGQAIAEITQGALTGSTSLYLGPSPEPSGNTIAFTTHIIKLQAQAVTVGIGNSFLLTGTQSDGSPLSSFLIPITITLKFDGNNLSNVNSATIQIYEWSEASQAWQPLPTILDLTGVQAIATTSRPSTTMLRAQPLHAAPIIASVTPTYLDSAQGGIITITGQNFQRAPTVDIGYATLDVNYVSDSVLTATVSPYIAQGIYPIILRNPDGQTAASTVTFSIMAPTFLPVVSNSSPSSR